MPRADMWRSVLARLDPRVVAVPTICLVGVLIYSNSFYAPFVFDDGHNIVDNRFLRVTELTPSALWDAAFRSPLRTRPVAYVSFALNYYWGKYEVFGYHVVNVIIHVLSAALVYFLALVTFGLPEAWAPGRAAPPPRSVISAMALVAGLVFVAHPLQTQSVTYVVQRMTSMAVMFSLVTMLCYVTGRRAVRGWRRRLWWATGLGTWVLALGAKPIAVVLPALIWLYEWYFFQGQSAAWLRRSAKYLVGAFALACLLAVVYFEGDPVERLLGGYRRRDFGMLERVLTQFRVVVLYVSLVLYPHPGRLNLIHHIDKSTSLLHPISTALSLLALVAILGLGVRLARTRRVVSFGILWFFLSLGLESSVIGLEMIFEHRLYMPLVGVSLMAALLMGPLLSADSAWQRGIPILVMASLCVATFQRNAVWSDAETFWSDVIAKNPRSFGAHTDLGIVLVQRGETMAAMDHYIEALRINPAHPEAHNNLGVLLVRQGDVRGALAHFSAAVRVRSNYAEAHNNLGAAFATVGQLAEAIAHFQRALALRPDNDPARQNLERALGLRHTGQSKRGP